MAYRYLHRPVTVERLIDALQSLEQKAKQPLIIVGGSLSEDTPPLRVCIVNTDGCDWEDYGGTIAGVFIE